MCGHLELQWVSYEITINTCNSIKKDPTISFLWLVSEFHRNPSLNVSRAQKFTALKISQENSALRKLRFRAKTAFSRGPFSTVSNISGDFCRKTPMKFFLIKSSTGWTCQTWPQTDSTAKETKCRYKRRNGVSAITRLFRRAEQRYLVFVNCRILSLSSI